MTAEPYAGVVVPSFVFLKTQLSFVTSFVNASSEYTVATAFFAVTLLLLLHRIPNYFDIQ